MGEVPSVPVHTRNVIGAVRTIRINLWRNVRSTPASDNYYSRLLDVGRHSKRQITERKMQGFNMQLKSRLNQLSFSHESNKKDEKRKKAKQKNRSWAIKSVNGHKIPKYNIYCHRKYQLGNVLSSWSIPSASSDWVPQPTGRQARWETDIHNT